MTTTYQIKALADRTGFSPATLRYYEDIGLLPPSARTASGYRTYDDAAVARLAFVARAKQLGCTLDEITALAGAWEGGECGPLQDGLRRLVDTKIAAAQDRIVELMTFTAELQAASAALGVHRPAGPCDDGCGCVGAPAPHTTATTPSTPGARVTAAGAGSSAPAASAGGTVGQAVQLGRRSDTGPTIACTLAPGDYHDRIGDWNRVLAGVVHRERTTTGALRAVFGADTDVREVARLAAAEQDCCRFFSFAITVDERGIALEVRAPEGANELVASVFGVAA